MNVALITETVTKEKDRERNCASKCLFAMFAKHTNLSLPPLTKHCSVMQIARNKIHCVFQELQVPSVDLCLSIAFKKLTDITEDIQLN